MVNKSASKTRNLSIDPKSVNGWGVDADPNNNPTYPYRVRTEAGGKPMDWKRPVFQRTDVEILQSVEYNRRPAVTGTTLPPRGASGRMRRAAFEYSESDWRHWLLLLGADRIDVVEGFFEDLAKGTPPDLAREMGLRAEWRHNREGLVQKVTFAAGAVLLGYILFQKRAISPGLNARRVPTAPRKRNGRSAGLQRPA